MACRNRRGPPLRLVARASGKAFERRHLDQADTTASFTFLQADDGGGPEPPSPWQHVSGPLARVIAGLRVVDDAEDDAA